MSLEKTFLASFKNDTYDIIGACSVWKQFQAIGRLAPAILAPKGLIPSPAVAPGVQFLHLLQAFKKVTAFPVVLADV